MPTGYTAGVMDGQITTLEQFAKVCIRNFGLAMHMRDGDPNAVYSNTFAEDFYDSSIKYHRDAIDKASAELDRVLNLSSSEVEVAAEEEIERLEQSWLDTNKKSSLTFKRYSDMRKLVEKWHPPKSCLMVKDFMLKQLDESLNCDCVEASEVPVRSPEDWLKQQIDRQSSAIRYHSEQWITDMQKKAEAQRMHLDFIESLKEFNVPINDVK